MSDNRLILLGTKGGPRIGKGTAWPTSNLLVVEGKPYLIDAGLGVTRQVCNAGFLPFDIDRIFLTHNHSDHNLELGGFIQTGWTSGPMSEMKIYGAPGATLQLRTLACHGRRFRRLCWRSGSLQHNLMKCNFPNHSGNHRSEHRHNRK